MAHECAACRHRCAAHGSGGIQNENHFAAGDVGLLRHLGRLNQQRECTVALTFVRQQTCLWQSASQGVTQHQITIIDGLSARQGDCLAGFIPGYR